MPRILAIVIALLVVLQYGAAAARATSPCCLEGCSDPAVCVVAACKACVAQAVVPTPLHITEPGHVQLPPDFAIQGILPSATSDIWRPPR